MAAAKLQYCDRMSSSMRTSFVQLLEANRRSFAIPAGEGRVLGGDLDKEEEGNDEQDFSDGHPSTVQTFSNLRKMALDITMQKTEAPASHEKVVVGVVTIWLAVISLLSFLKPNLEQWKLAIGIIVNINLCFFYGAPLSTIFTVLKTRDSSSIHRVSLSISTYSKQQKSNILSLSFFAGQWTMMMNTANACFWTAFGFGIMDWIIIVPNGLGAILGFIQMFLRLVVPSRETFPSSGEIERQDELSVGGTDVDIEATVSASTAEASTNNGS
eukprot:CAMPEP_0201992858 /NCGR_PEP_ID=MMETSP0905-20130828/1274_1 /ASSEMBLY_ACC=CAM_ASM_000554 /TAXON_ID=420261 /ORGANISM="Thalassiosira antarctica, Strain CCMP982" /LENGTH=269 /DNA_ID=CAMNT_0048547595 /DNA_START=329 /DNA_END=1138 /DNA_ORIENTATION=-